MTDHSAVPVMTLAYAHLIMQIHIECPTSVCPLRSQALRTLVEAGRIVPASIPKMGF
ncbi:hypothetical protein ACWDSJ_17510 [Nocardia sp. NPDC003482]|uniref:hypothetical protein n=1 Tax=Nocardia sp. NPDC004068 TaxID=3364303 RepID=UPI0036CE5662